MNNTRVLQFVVGGVCIVLSALLFPFRADQEFINLTPSEGAGTLISIKSDNTYEQTFSTRNKNISKIGVYLMPVHASAKASQGKIRIELMRDGIVKAFGEIPVFQIDNDGASLVRIEPPYASPLGENSTMRISVSSDASGLVALRKRFVDETFSSADVTFSLNGKHESTPVAYRVFESIWPPFTRQIAGIVGVAGLLLICWPVTIKYKNYVMLFVVLCIAALQAIPAIGTYPMYMPIVAGLVTLTWAILRISGRTQLASVFGACIFVCSSWLALYFTSGGEVSGLLSVRDALLDPNQIHVSHSAGGYVGIPAILFAISGILVWITRFAQRGFRAVQADTGIAILLVLSMLCSFAQWPIYSSRGIIVVVFCIAWFASLAFDTLQRFLGLRDKFIQTLMLLLFIISLLDLMHVVARTFSYGLGL